MRWYDLDYAAGIPRVNVLISTYNGKEYIKEQIESILHQTYSNIHIYIRDDGSNDGTIEVLESYDCDAITIIKGEQIGYGKSFLSLLRLASEGEYWAYCDQDDVWFPEKISVAVQWLKQQESVPCMFHSAYYNTDEYLKPIEVIKKPDFRFNFQRAITECVHMGFSEVMNASLRELVLKADENNLITHDWWTELVAMKYGTVKYDNTPMTYHRRLGQSVSGSSLRQRIRWFLRAWKGNAEIRSCTAEFERVFGYDPEDKDSVVNHWFCGTGYSIKNAVSKAFYPHRWRSSISSELVIRLLMLFGKI